MGKPCAKQGDQIVAVDTHLYPGSPPVPGPHPYTGIIQIKTHPTINVMGMPSATVGTKSMNTPPHVPAVDGPNNIGEIIMGSTGVKFNNQMVGRLGDIANTCQIASAPAPLGQVVCGGTVLAGEIGVAVVVVVQQPIVAQAAQMQAAEAVELQKEAAATAAALQKIWSDLGLGGGAAAAAAATNCSEASANIGAALASNDPDAVASSCADAQQAIDEGNEIIAAAEEEEESRSDRSGEYMRAAQTNARQAQNMANRAQRAASSASSASDAARMGADQIGPLTEARDEAQERVDAATEVREQAQERYDQAQDVFEPQDEAYQAARKAKIKARDALNKAKRELKKAGG